MRLNDIVEMQKVLDGRILTSFNKTSKETVLNRILAMMVELGELANETRCFKYWSKKGPAEREVILEEYVDGIHFIVSLGNEINFNFSEQEIFGVKAFDTEMTQSFITIFKRVCEISENLNDSNFEILFKDYISLGYQLGFSKEDIFGAYESKNKVNHERQENNY